MSDDAEGSLKVESGARCGVENAHEDCGKDNRDERDSDYDADVAEDGSELRLTVDNLLALLGRQLFQPGLRGGALRDLFFHEGAPADALAEDRRDSALKDDEHQNRDKPGGLAGDVLERRARICDRAND